MKSIVIIPAFNEEKFIADVIFNTLNNINDNVIALNSFKKNVLSKRNNPAEYYKSLI